MLGLEGEDRPLDLHGQRAMALHLRRAEEARHPLALEARRLPVEGALRRAGQTGALGRGVPEEDDGADELVGALLGEADEQVELLPIVGRRRLRCRCPIVVHPPLRERRRASSSTRARHPNIMSSGGVYVSHPLIANMCGESYEEVCAAIY